jgi:hypothetical protein
MEIIYKQNI